MGARLMGCCLVRRWEGELIVGSCGWEIACRSFLLQTCLTPTQTESTQSHPTQATYFGSGDVAPSEYHHYGLASPIYTHFTSPIRRCVRVCGGGGRKQNDPLLCPRAETSATDTPTDTPLSTPFQPPIRPNPTDVHPPPPPKGTPMSSSTACWARSSASPPFPRQSGTRRPSASAPTT